MNLASHFTGVGGAIVLALIAFSVVFMVLAGLSLIIAGLQHFTKAIEGMSQKKSAPASSPAAKSAPAKAVSVAGENKDQLVAVITAAIAATAGPGFKITGIRPVLNVRKDYTRGWKSHSRLDNLEGFEA
jgi:Na+-transporting methylmalonyl-CoA/oxaloacetate decarboxylase gamma subunit